ncbi:MAG TPA: MFS transporter [Pirellulales bacterium]|nr:MFS transporter [Pirellulales bacterium]
MPGESHANDATHLPRIRGALRRRALTLGYVNGVLWSVGNGLTTGTLVYYLAQELGAKGTALGVLIAAPSLIGLLRLATPALIGPLGGIKATCLKASLASYLLLAIGLPGVTLAPGIQRSTALAGLLTLICVHQLLEYVGSVALWSWLSALVPVRIRGRYFGRRQVWQLLFLMPALFLSGRFTDDWKQTYKESQPERLLLGYIIPNCVGAGLLLASLVPLVMMPDVPAPRRRASMTRRWPVGDLAFRRLLVYRAWFSFFNGISQAAQNIYVYVLGIGVLPMQMMQLGMRGGQMALSPLAGRASDRFGNRPVLELSQALVALGLLFYFLASPEHPWWITGAWVFWSAYVGLNICLTNIMLKLAPSQDNAGYIASFEALGGVAYGLSTLAGGYLFDRLRDAHFHTSLGGIEIDHFAILFLVGVITRALGVVWLARIPEPGAWRWREILKRRPS